MADGVVVDIVMRRAKLDKGGELASTADPFLDLQVRLHKDKLSPHPWTEGTGAIADYYVSLIRDYAFHNSPPEEGVDYCVKLTRDDQQH
jgi:hypothetical protein